MSTRAAFPFTLSLLAVLALSACGGDSSSTLAVPSAPAGSGTTDSAAVADETTVPPFVDFAYSNQRGDARYATLSTNAGVRVVKGFLDLWTPSTEIVDAGVTAAAVYDTSGNLLFPAVVASTWTGIPGDSTDGTVVNATVLNANIAYAASVTASRTADQATAAYLDDRRGKGYSVTDGLGPLTSAWRSAAQQTTSITSVASDATTVLYSDSGNNVGVTTANGNTTFGLAVDMVNGIGQYGSTEPSKRFYKYARPWRWSSSVVMLPTLVPAESATPATDGGQPSGHSAEAVRDSLAMAYVVPERFQELVARGLELGENRILAGMHSPLDVIGGRMLGLASAVASLDTGTDSTIRAAAYTQGHAVLMSAAGVTTTAALNTYAHSAATSADRFADHATNKANVLRRLTFGFTQIGATTAAATVPKGAEVLLETRLPYLDATQRRVVLKTTAVASGYPLMDDAEGWGRLNLFAAADGYGAFNGDTTVTMDATLGGFSAFDTWQNDISGVGKLTKAGSGTLALNGANTYSGGTEIDAGVLEAASAKALGTGDVYLAGGTLVSDAATAVTIAGDFTEQAGTTLELDIGGSGAGRLSVAGNMIIVGGTLDVVFAAGATPSVGDTIDLIGATRLQGKFTTITVAGFKVTPTYTSTGVLLHIDSVAG
jgi:autotransporter-associated beta strand protein